MAVKEHGQHRGDLDGRRRRKGKAKKGKGSSGVKLMEKTILEDNAWFRSLGQDTYLVGRGQVMGIPGAKSFCEPDFRRGEGGTLCGGGVVASGAAPVAERVGLFGVWGLQLEPAVGGYPARGPRDARVGTECAQHPLHFCNCI